LLGGVDFVASIDGVRFRCRPYELIDFRLAFLGAHDSEVVEALARCLQRRPDAVVWDVGANIGAVTLPLAKRFPSARFFAFEPSPRVAARLFENLSLNPELAARIRTVSVALSDSAGYATFRAAFARDNQGTGHIFVGTAEANRGEDPQFLVACASGDNLVANGTLPAPEILKIDVEGHECAVLAGLDQTLKDPKVELVVEHCVWRLAHRGLPNDAIARQLEKRGFALSLVGGEAAEQAVTPSHLTTDRDIYARKRA
jgi:FkbM family methyltransferase